MISMKPGPGPEGTKIDLDRTHSGLSLSERERFSMVFGGHILFQTLSAAVEFDLFTILSERPGQTIGQLCDRLKIDLQPARILLLGLASSKLLKRDRQGRYSNSKAAELLLTRHSPKTLVSYVLLQKQVMYDGMRYFYDSIRENKNLGLQSVRGSEPTLYARLGHDLKLKAIFQKAMHQLSSHANAELAAKVDLGGIKCLVDVGGGDGTNAIELARKHPGIRVLVFDLPSVREIAEENIRRSGVRDRVCFVSGNCFEDDFPAGADCFLFSHFCTIWSTSKNRDLFKKAHSALPRSGKVIVFNMMQDNSETGPISAALGSPYFLTIATGEGMLYTWQEYKTWLRACGFSKISHLKLPADHGAIIGVK